MTTPSLQNFWNDLHYEDIHFRDVWQIELQSDFAINISQKKNISTQEFYIFIPQSLQVNKDSYSKDDFYKDRTNLIRFKTPEFTLDELLIPTNTQSPFIRLVHAMERPPSEEEVAFVENELKLLGNVVRSSLRTTARHIVDKIERDEIGDSKKKITLFCDEIHQFRRAFFEVQKDNKKRWKEESLNTHFVYVDEFISRSIDYYCTGLLATLREKELPGMSHADNELCGIINEEKAYRKREYNETELTKTFSEQGENVLFRKGLLNKFVLDALLLDLEKSAWRQRYGAVVGAVAATIAMLVYVIALVFTIGMNLTVINSMSFLLLTVFIYVLKDRIKDGLKDLFHQHAFRWFADYTTKIMSYSGNIIGRLKESFSFIDRDDVPDEITQMQKKALGDDFPVLLRYEEIIYYKKEMILTKNPERIRSRKKKLHNIFLFNIHALLEKASDPLETQILLDAHQKLKIVLFPKVYHIHVIVKNSASRADGTKVEIKMFRVVIDKRGIRRVEHVASKHLSP